MLAGPLIAVLNHLLHGQPWLMSRLRPHAGRTVALDIAPLRTGFAIGVDGSFVEAGKDSVPETTLRLSALTALRLLRGEAAARQSVHVDGDSELAAALNDVLPALRWDAEEDLSRVLGDTAAHRIVEASRRLGAWPAAAAETLAANLSEYLVEEKPLIAGKADLAQWTAEVDALRDDVERLAKRVDRLASRRVD